MTYSINWPITVRSAVPFYYGPLISELQNLAVTDLKKTTTTTTQTVTMATTTMIIVVSLTPTHSKTLYYSNSAIKTRIGAYIPF